MATQEDVKKLAMLARIRIKDADLEKFTVEFDAILAYIRHLEKLELPKEVEIPQGVPQGVALRSDPRNETILRNVMMEDTEPHAPGVYTEKIAEQFSAREGDSLSVKQIISND